MRARVNAGNLLLVCTAVLMVLGPAADSASNGIAAASPDTRYTTPDGERSPAGRSIVVISQSTCITLALGTFDAGLQPFPDEMSGQSSFRADVPLSITGQLVDGNYTLLSYGGGREAARRNHGVSGNGENVRWWFDQAEQSPLPVGWRAPGTPDNGAINGTFFVRDWIPDPGLIAEAGIHQMRFVFDGTRINYPGYGEFQIYPPTELAIDVEVRLSSHCTLTVPDAADAGGNARIYGNAAGGDGLIIDGKAVVWADGKTLGPQLPEGVYIDDITVSIPGIPTVVFQDGFEGNDRGYVTSGEGADWEAGIPVDGPAAYRGKACLGTNLDGSYSHLADETIQTPPIDLSGHLAPAQLTFACWMNLSSGDFFEVRIWNGNAYSDAVLIQEDARWSMCTIELDKLTRRGESFPVTGTRELSAAFRIKSSTPSAVVKNGQFGLDWVVPAGMTVGPHQLMMKFIPDGPYSPSFSYRNVAVRGLLHFEVPVSVAAMPGGWAQIDCRLADASGNAPALEPGNELSSLIQVLWDNGTGSPVEAEGKTAVNVTGCFAAAHRLCDGEKLGDARFLLDFTGNALYQPAAAQTGVSVLGEPRIEFNFTGGVLRGSAISLGGRLLLGTVPVFGTSVALAIPFEPYTLNDTTDVWGNFSVAFRVPDDYPRFVIHVDVCTLHSVGPVGDASASIDIPVLRAIRILFDGTSGFKGSAVESTFDGWQFKGLAGRVVDEQGRGVSGARVAIRADQPGGTCLIGTTATGPTGYFSLPYAIPPNVPPGNLVLRLSASVQSAVPAEQSGTLAVKTATRIRLDSVAVLRQGYCALITGTLRENQDMTEGDAVANVPVAVSFAQTNCFAVTDAGGRFRAVIWANVPGNASYTIEARCTDGTFLTGSADTITVYVKGADPQVNALPTSSVPVKQDAGAAVAAVSVFAALFTALAIAGTEIGRVKVLLFFVPLYSKIRKEQVLDQFVRGQVFGYIQANPGDHYTNIREHLRLQNGTLAYHIRRLEREQFVFSRSDGVYRRFYPTGADPARYRMKKELKDTHRRIVDAIELKPGITPNDLAKELGKSHQVISYHIRLLSRRGAIRLEQKGRNTLCYPGTVLDAGGARQ